MNESATDTLHRLAVAALDRKIAQLEKTSFVDPMMMQQGGQMMDPAMGGMDPAMGGMPPMDPMGGMPPMDPMGGMPMDPGMAGPPVDPAMTEPPPEPPPEAAPVAKAKGPSTAESLKQLADDVYLIRKAVGQLFQALGLPLDPSILIDERRDAEIAPEEPAPEELPPEELPPETLQHILTGEPPAESPAAPGLQPMEGMQGFPAAPKMAETGEGISDSVLAPLGKTSKLFSALGVRRS